jgi:hypothetical protein
MKWTTTDQSEAFGISERHVRRLIKLGILPKTDDPKKITLAYVLYLRGSKGEKSDLIEERTRLTRAQANQKEWDLKISQGEYLPVDSAMALWGQVVQSIRSLILAFPSRLAPLVLGCISLSEIKEIAEKLTHEVLEEIANPDLKKYSKVLRADSTDMPNAKATHKANRQSMGRSKKSSKRGK